MHIARITPVISLVLFCAVGCGKSDKPGSGSSETTSTASAGANAAAAPGANRKLVHIKQSKGPCTFEFDAPESLKETKRDGMSFTLESSAFSFDGFEGSSLYGMDQLAGLAAIGGKSEVISKGTANGINLVITRFPTPSNPVVAVTGHGEEANVKDRQLGCSFLCNGIKEREADVIAMSKSVRISYDASKAE